MFPLFSRTPSVICFPVHIAFFAHFITFNVIPTGMITAFPSLIYTHIA